MAEPIEWDDAAFEAALARSWSEGVIDASGVAIDADLLARIIAAAPVDHDARPRLGARFRGATFTESADFEEVIFRGQVDFTASTFLGEALFFENQFPSGADFQDARFSGPADFRKARFGEVAGFSGAVFGRDALFVGAVFDDDAWFDATTFERARELGFMRVAGALVLDRAEFAQPVRIGVEASRVSCSQTVFRGAADLFAGGADVSLEDADFGQPSLVAPPPGGDRPRVVSVRRAKVAQLTLSGVDLRACRFEGAHGLDRMRLEGVELERPPAGRRRVLTWWWPRDTVAEERHWRAVEGHGTGWYDDGVRAPDWLDDVDHPPGAEAITGIYRALRKGREDSKDEPGAADFYYGEMEMRRHAPHRRRVISLLWLYWLVSGYGLRANRALVALAVTIALGAVAFQLVGFDPGTHAEDGTPLFAAESSISLLRAPDTENLTASGHVTQIVLRLAGPLFFALALLALRGRVKR